MQHILGAFPGVSILNTNIKQTKTLPCNGIVSGMYVLLDSRLAFSLKTVYQIYLDPILLYFHDWPGFYGFQSVVMHQWTALFHVIVYIYTLRFTCLVVYCQICVIEQSSTRCTNHLCPTSTTFIPLIHSQLKCQPYSKVFWISFIPNPPLSKHNQQTNPSTVKVNLIRKSRKKYIRLKHPSS